MFPLIREDAAVIATKSRPYFSHITVYFHQNITMYCLIVSVYSINADNIEYWQLAIEFRIQIGVRIGMDFPMTWKDVVAIFPQMGPYSPDVIISLLFQCHNIFVYSLVNMYEISHIVVLTIGVCWIIACEILMKGRIWVDVSSSSSSSSCLFKKNISNGGTNNAHDIEKNTQIISQQYSEPWQNVIK